MRKTGHPLIVPLLFFCLALSLISCQAGGAPTALPSSSNVAWQIQVSRFEIKDNLNAVESVTQYNGSKIDVVHKQSPDAGSVYLIINASISKSGVQSSTPFDWKWLVVKDASGNSYQRLDNDTFLEQFQYTPRITGLQLRLGEYTGWMCYQIPASAATGKLTLAYTGEGSQQEILLQK
jgi:hypothetical protein